MGNNLPLNKMNTNAVSWSFIILKTSTLLLVHLSCKEF
jgi:hypothetical protein